MIFTSKATLPEGGGRGSKEAKKGSGKLDFDARHGAAVYPWPLPVLGCHLSSKNMTKGSYELETDLTQMSDITT